MIQLKQLEGQDFINEFKFENKYYLETLFKKIKNFLIHIPVPYVVDFDKENNILFFRIGDNKKSFQLNQNIYYADFITMMKKYVTQFYPQYYVGDEYGIVLKIFFKSNEFLFFNNGTKELRYAGKRNFLLSLTDFLKEIRQLTDANDIKNFVFDNSTLIEKIDSDQYDIRIAYSEEMMKNFFVINFDELKNCQVGRIGDKKYKIGKYDIYFINDISEKECLDYLANRKS